MRLVKRLRRMVSRLASQGRLADAAWVSELIRRVQAMREEDGRA